MSDPEQPTEVPADPSGTTAITIPAAEAPAEEAKKKKHRGLQESLILSIQVLDTSSRFALANKLMLQILALRKEAEKKGHQVALIHIELTTVPQDMVEEATRASILKKAAMEGMRKRVNKRIKEKKESP